MAGKAGVEEEVIVFYLAMFIQEYICQCFSQFMLLICISSEGGFFIM